MLGLPVKVNLTLSGGGVKGIAYTGVEAVAARRGYAWGNIAGVSAGALAGTLIAAGYRGHELWGVMESLDFNQMQIGKSVASMRVVTMFQEYTHSFRALENNTDIGEMLAGFLHLRPRGERPDGKVEYTDFPELTRGVLGSIMSYGNEGCLFDGDYMEEWLYNVLERKGIKTFADLRGGIQDPGNPRGYKARMTGVDCNRAKSVTLPDDISFYGIDPDRLEVAKAVRISTCVPFAFKPVVLSKKSEGSEKKYHLVDGGVFDNFPHWLNTSSAVPRIGLKLGDASKKKLFSVDTALAILKSLVGFVTDIGIPKDVPPMKYVGEINTQKVSSLNFSLTAKDKENLYDAGRQTALFLFKKFEQNMIKYRFGFRGFIPTLFRRK